MQRSAAFARITRRSVALGLAAFCVLGISAAPAHAETVRKRQWHLDAMGAEEIWAMSTGAGITVAVVDTGVDAQLPDLAGQVVPGKDYGDPDGGVQSDPDGHGTRMAVLIAGTGKSDGGTGGYGLAPGARIRPFHVVQGGEAISRRNGNAVVSRAIRDAADSDAKIINLSVGGMSRIRQEAEAVEYALSKGKLLFAATGNDGMDDAVDYPAAYPGVVAVGAVDESGKVTKESNQGPEVALGAPGDNMVMTCKGGTGVCRSHGTSDATAIASASAALVWSAHPDWTANQVLRVLINTAGAAKSGDKRTTAIGYGIVRPYRALQNPGDPGPPDVSPLPERAPKPTPSPTVAPAKTATTAASKEQQHSLLSTRNVLTAAAVAAFAAGATAAVLVTRRRSQRARKP
ncbi:type VII secretion-associated serine protease [Streptomyces mashuensis]|uniref:Type VII secretion-associated serine protease n=1 Tax=Streptomyces mashuensis TaxID=33904 RepID=A0A919ECN5_9ACTN|nr:type VII secretion-associated serine protease mycosin [Streptomyces mashuensis]GHF37235.1 type VII secretion-associated serine protease [Streptomyces mashuensis]